MKKVLIVGGGIAGLSTALALRRHDIAVDLVEINRESTVSPVGIVVQGNALRSLAELGIAEQCAAVGFPFEGAAVPAGLGLTRLALHKVLTDAVGAAGVNVRLGVSFKEIRDLGRAVGVSFTDGTSGGYDLVVGADGAYSKVREVLFGKSWRPVFTGQGVWRYNVPRPPELTRAVMFAGSEAGKCGFIPLSQDTGCVLLVQTEVENERIPQEQLAEQFRARLARCTGVMARLREHIVDPRFVVYWPLYGIFVPAPWYKGRVMLIGDAVHAITPHLGPRVAQAMEDGIVLGELCAQRMPVEELLAIFMRRRYEQCRLIHEGPPQIGDWEQRPVPEADPAGLTARVRQVFAQ